MAEGSRSSSSRLPEEDYNNSLTSPRPDFEGYSATQIGNGNQRLMESGGGAKAPEPCAGTEQSPFAFFLKFFIKMLILR